VSLPEHRSMEPGAAEERGGTAWWAAIVDPASLVTRHFDGLGVPAALLLSTLAFTTISLQAALDLARSRGDGAAELAGLVLRGGLLGSAGVAALGLAAWVLTRPFGGPGPGTALRAVGGAYASALVYGLVGLGLNLLLGWNTSVSCGVTGLLWALGPLYLALRELAGGRAGVAALLSTLCGSGMLLGWVWWGVGA
jgi:hypothetical protein